MEKEVYTQSLCLINEAVELYYVEGMNQLEIGERLHISKPTVSRLLKQANRYGIVQVHVESHFMDCLKLQKQLMERYPIKRIYVVPIIEQTSESQLKQSVAIEGARYLQRILSDKELLGMAWGGTVHSMIRSLNPCQKKNISVVTMQGDIYKCGDDYNLESLVRRAALTFSGNKYVITDSGFLGSRFEVEEKIQNKYRQYFEHYFQNISISIAGAGGWKPFVRSALRNENSGYLTPKEQKQLIEQGVVTDFILHMLNEDGEEIDSPIRERTMSIQLEDYKKIPEKIVLLSGEGKAYTAKAILSGGYADTIFMDYQLAKKLYYLN